MLADIYHTVSCCSKGAAYRFITADGTNRSGPGPTWAASQSVERRAGARLTALPPVVTVVGYEWKGHYHQALLLDQDLLPIAPLPHNTCIRLRSAELT